MPLIGITLDYETTPTYAAYPWYALRENYFSWVSAHGGTPIGLPHEVGLVDRYIDVIDGLIITGGNFDVDPSLYGAVERHETVTLKEKRTAFEWAITDRALARKKPILGICGGEQLLNVMLGGSLIQHVPDEVESALEHEQKHDRGKAGHAIRVEENTLLHRIVGATRMNVNSSHHQAVKALGKNVIVNARAEDGVIEGIEATDHPFCLGVQWHPEYAVDAGDVNIIRSFIQACERP